MRGVFRFPAFGAGRPRFDGAKPEQDGGGDRCQARIWWLTGWGASAIFSGVRSRCTRQRPLTSIVRAYQIFVFPFRAPGAPLSPLGGGVFGVNSAVIVSRSSWPFSAFAFRERRGVSRCRPPASSEVSGANGHSIPAVLRRARFPWAACRRCATSSVSLPLGRVARASMGPSPNKTVEVTAANARIWWLTRPGASCILRSAEPLHGGSGPSPPPFDNKKGARKCHS